LRCKDRLERILIATAMDQGRPYLAPNGAFSLTPITPAKEA
jgi:hypothetical protein